jgi:hypothetical protein
VEAEETAETAETVDTAETTEVPSDLVSTSDGATAEALAEAKADSDEA